jgi:mannose-6-phosphate isomerase
VQSLYPLRFSPIFRRYLWGGRRLATQLGKPLGEGADFAESWEIVDRGDDQSRVVAGPLKGTSLKELVHQMGAKLLGKHYPQTRFPLLFKFLDCQQKLSVQVHPDDARALLLDPPDLGKTEAWIVLAAEPESEIYAGLKRGFDRHALEREVQRGTSELCLHKIHPAPGDCIFIPAGTVHALGAGLLVAEIQQASDTTWRLHDWNRVDANGKPRKLHIEEALEAIDYERGPVAAQEPTATEQKHVERLVKCEKFVLDRWRFDAPKSIGGDERFHLLVVLSGAVRVEGDLVEYPLSLGQTMLLPAAAGSVSLTPLEPTVMLDIYLP